MSEATTDAIVACAITRRYGGVTALAGLDLTLARGAVTGVLGPNGAGKSSFVGLVLGRGRADSGRLSVLGHAPGSLAARRLTGAMLQSAALAPQLTVREHVELQRGYYPQPRPLDWILENAGLVALAGRRYAALSGGEQRRVQFALAICAQVELLVLDEPTVALDAPARRALWTVVRELAGQGTAVLLTTHQLEEAEALADRVVLLAGGRLLADGTPADIRARVAARRVRCATSLALAQLAALPGVVDVAQEGRHATLRTRSAEHTVRALLAADAALADLEVTGASLEDAVIDLVRKEAA